MGEGLRLSTAGIVAGVIGAIAVTGVAVDARFGDADWSGDVRCYHTRPSSRSPPSHHGFRPAAPPVWIPRRRRAPTV